MKRLALLDISARAVEPRLFVVPEREADRALGLYIGRVEDARELHDERGPRAIVIRRFTPTVAIHVGTDDVHLLRMGRSDFGAIDLLARAVRRRLAVELAEHLVRLRHRVVVHARAAAIAEDRASTRPRAVAADAASRGRAVRRVELPCRPTPPRARRRIEDVVYARGARAANGFELRLDPVDGVAIALRALAAIAELRQTFERCFVLL